MVSLLVGAVVGGATVGAFEAARLFHVDSSAPIWLGGIAAVIAFFAFALEFDSEIDPVSRTSDLPGGPLGPALGMIAAAVTVLMARRPEPVETVRSWWYRRSTLVAPFIVLSLSAGIVQIKDWWPEFYAVGQTIATDYWIYAIIGALLLVHALAWQYLETARVRGEEVEADEGIDPIATKWIIVFVLVVMDLALLLYMVLAFLPSRLVEEDGLTAVQFAQAITDERRTLLAVLAGLGAGLTLLYTHLRHQLDRDANATGRYTQAIEQIGSAVVSIRLGGIYALGRLQRDSPNDARTISEVLASFVRESAGRPPNGGVDPDLTAAIGVLGRGGIASWNADLRGTRLSYGELEELSFPKDADLRKSELTGADLSRARLPGARLDNSDMKNVILDGSNLVAFEMKGGDVSGASFFRADARRAQIYRTVGNEPLFRQTSLKGAHFENVQFRNAIFSGAELENAYFWYSTFVGTDLSHCDMNGIHVKDSDLTDSSMVSSNLRSARFHTANLTNVNFKDADLTGAQIINCILTGADLSGADLRRASLANDVTGFVYCDDRTRWPSDIDALDLGLASRFPRGEAGPKDEPY